MKRVLGGVDVVKRVLVGGVDVVKRGEYLGEISSVLVGGVDVEKLSQNRFSIIIRRSVSELTRETTKSESKKRSLTCGSSLTCVVPKKGHKAREAPRDHSQKNGSVAEPHVPIKGNYVFANRPANVLPTPQERRQSTPFRDSRALGNNRRKETVCTH